MASIRGAKQSLTGIFSSVKEYGKPKAQYGSADYQSGVDMAFGHQFKAFAQAIRSQSNESIRGPFAEGFKSTVAVNYADLAMRTGIPVHLDHASLEIKDNPDAQSQLIRKYREGYSHPYAT